jgi:SNF2 family DNA or RNA helicase
MYSDFVDRGAVVKEIMRGEKNSPLEAITWLKKLCGHPLIACPQQGELVDVLEQLGPDEVIVQSAKLDLLVRLVSKLRRKGHRTLIFSQSTKTLDIIEFVLQDRISLSRIDGSTKEKDRQARVDEFNSEFSDTDAMILSTKAAGVGLTLVGADACIIYDPSCM